MKASDRAITNTIVQYIRAVFSIIVTLYTSRVILENLGVNDFGIYSLVGGVITMFSFIQNSLSRTTQRFLNYNQGKEDYSMVKSVFNNCVICQGIVSIILCLILIAVINPVFDSLLNIEATRISEAKQVYLLMIVSLFFNLSSTPYIAALIARENIVYSSIVQIVDSIIKLPIAISLFYISNGKLIWYTLMITLLAILNFMMYFIYTKRKYSECQGFTFRSYNKQIVKEILSFSVWSTYGTIAVIGRSQGIAILLNRFYSTAINSAYGIGNQIVGQLSFISAAIATALNPQMVKAEGAGNRNKAIQIAEIGTKFSCLLLALILVPAFFYMDFLLGVWLVEVPEYTSMFCKAIIIITFIELLTQSINFLNGAIGNIKSYTNLVYTVTLLTIPISYIVLKLGFGPLWVMVSYAVMATICGAIRLIYMRYNIGLSIRKFFSNAITPSILIISVDSAICFTLHMILPGWYIILTAILSVILTVSLIYFIALNNTEKQIVVQFLSKLFSIFIRNHSNKTQPAK